MKNDPDDNVFPFVVTPDNENYNEGIYLRTYLAAKAMAAIIGKIPLRAEAGGAQREAGIKPETQADFDSQAKSTAKGAVGYADALIAELNKPTEPTP
jgi:hypothetical protein